MKVKLLKDYLSHTAGDVIEVATQRGGYLVRIGTATTVKSVKQAYINKPKKKK